jgi:hypothetical protein
MLFGNLWVERVHGNLVQNWRSQIVFRFGFKRKKKFKENLWA